MTAPDIEFGSTPDIQLGSMPLQDAGDEPADDAIPDVLLMLPEEAARPWFDHVWLPALTLYVMGGLTPTGMGAPVFR